MLLHVYSSKESPDKAADDEEHQRKNQVGKRAQADQDFNFSFFYIKKRHGKKKRKS